MFRLAWQKIGRLRTPRSLVPNVAGIASYGEPEHMFSLDRFGVATGRNEREYQQQTRFERAVPCRSAMTTNETEGVRRSFNAAIPPIRNIFLQRNIGTLALDERHCS
jgi:hypothetical protein